ncbi:GldG family protein [Candidatus Micrarchaeota archaeon]|nr:GldG family protein [Candidatus Micrarchaeota archaeon]
MSLEDDFKKEIPHVLVLGILLLILLVVVTKFKWVHCSQVPGDWCNVYCGIMGNSRVAIVSGANGTGDPSALFNLTSNLRQHTLLEPYPDSALSASILENYELVVFERMQDITPNQMNAIMQYLDRGGSVIWVADAGTRHYLSPMDLLDARNRNESDPGYYEWFVKEINTTKGFGDLSSLLKVSYQGIENGTDVRLLVSDRNSLMAQGLNASFSIDAKQVAIVNTDVSEATIVYSLYGTKSCTFERPCPAVVARKYAGWVVYTAFPPEEIRSQTALNNLFDFLVTC